MEFSASTLQCWPSVNIVCMYSGSNQSLKGEFRIWAYFIKINPLCTIFVMSARFTPAPSALYLYPAKYESAGKRLPLQRASCPFSSKEGQKLRNVRRLAILSEVPAAEKWVKYTMMLFFFHPESGTRGLIAMLVA